MRLVDVFGLSTKLPLIINSVQSRLMKGTGIYGIQRTDVLRNNDNSYYNKSNYDYKGHRCVLLFPDSDTRVWEKQTIRVLYMLVGKGRMDGGIDVLGKACVVAIAADG